MGVSRALARVLPPANLPLSALYGGRLGWGCRRAQARLCGRAIRPFSLMSQHTLERVFVRIRIYWIIGFSGFSRRAASFGKRSSIFVLAGFPVMARSASRERRNPENPSNPDSDKDAQSPAPPQVSTSGTRAAPRSSLLSLLSEKRESAIFPNYTAFPSIPRISSSTSPSITYSSAIRWKQRWR